MNAPLASNRDAATPRRSARLALLAVLTYLAAACCFVPEPYEEHEEHEWHHHPGWHEGEHRGPH